MTAIPHFSLSISDLTQSQSFYTDVMQGKPGRQRELWCDIWLFGVQLTLYHRPKAIVPLPFRHGFHFGATLPWTEWIQFRDHLDKLDVSYEMSPNINEQAGTAKLMLADPDGYLLEIKSYKDIHSQLLTP